MIEPHKTPDAPLTKTTAKIARQFVRERFGGLQGNEVYLGVAMDAMDYYANRDYEQERKPAEICPTCRGKGMLIPMGAPAGSAALYATKSQIAAAAARTAAEWIDREMWVEAYMELHQAARICWERRNEERKQPNND